MWPLGTQQTLNGASVSGSSSLSGDLRGGQGQDWACSASTTGPSPGSVGPLSTPVSDLHPEKGTSLSWAGTGADLGGQGTVHPAELPCGLQNRSLVDPGAMSRVGGRPWVGEVPATLEAGGGGQRGGWGSCDHRLAAPVLTC